MKKEWLIYRLPHHPKVGMSSSIYARIDELEDKGYNIADWYIIDSVYDTRANAEKIEVMWQKYYGCVDHRSQSTRDKISEQLKRYGNIQDTFRSNFNSPRGKAVMQFDLDMRLIAVYASLSAAANVNEVSTGAISSTLSGRQRTCAGSLWMWLPETMELPERILYIH